MLRNKEFRHFIYIYSIAAAVTVTAGFVIHLYAGILALFSTISFGLLFVVFTGNRYRSIAQISEEIDLVLHDADHLFIAKLEEGELSVLQSEITKMTQRIREQNKALQKEKQHLADSLADIAHQLRTPLTSANLILSLLENSPEEKEQKELLRETKELFSQMDWLLTSLLKLSRLDAGVIVFQNSPVEISSLINAACHPFLLSMELHNITLQTNIPDGIFIQGDLGWLSEAVANILKNCMESAGDNGKIEIICEDNLLFTQITIHDNGAGIPKEDLRFMFDRFYRGKNTDATGYGIGLALCKTIILRQNGTVTAQNHPLGGAVFTIRFPK